MPEPNNILQFLDRHTQGVSQPQTVLKFEYKGCKIELSIDSKENARELLETCFQNAIYLKNSAK